MTGDYVIYCNLVNVWVSGLTDRWKVTYTLDRRKAMRFGTVEKAEKMFARLPYVWKVHCEIMGYAKSTRRHDDYFAEQDEYYRKKFTDVRK